MTDETQSAPRLSVAIPTFNFGGFIGETLRSIIADLPVGVEVVVVDGASTDNTAEVVAALQRSCSAIRYERLDRRGGIDHDMAQAVALSRGDYCWLFSADDIMRPGALSALLRRCGSGADVYLLAHRDCTIGMQAIADRHPVLAGGDERYNLAEPGERIRYFERAETTEAFFSFMSTLVIRRTKWLEGDQGDRFFGTCWAHAARLLALIPSAGLMVEHLATPLLDRRGENDSFSNGGIVKRYALAIEGYHRIADEIFGSESREAFHIRRVLRNEFTLRYFLYAKSRCDAEPDNENRAHLDRLVRLAFRDGGFRAWAASALYFVLPTSFYRRAARLYRLLRPVAAGA